MHNQECSDVGSLVSIREAVEGCFGLEETRGLQPCTLKELARYLSELATDCESKGLGRVEMLTPMILDDHALVRCCGRGAPLVKAVVWSLRTLGVRVPVKVDTDSCTTWTLRCSHACGGCVQVRAAVW